jgi:hypothetical protein
MSGALLTGCFGGKPDAANIELRKTVQSLEQKVADADRKQIADRKAIAALQADRTLSILPADRIDRLFHMAVLRIARLAGGVDLDPARAGDEGFQISFAPVDQYGDDFKSAGSFTVELFDLRARDTRLGSWTVEPLQSHKNWISSAVMDAYVFESAWKTTPVGDRLLVKVTFVEELTGRSFDATAEIDIRPPGK